MARSFHKEEAVGRQQVLLVGKGGVGKTTLASALGRTVALQGQRVLMIDADPDGTLGFLLDAPVTGTVTDLKDDLKEARERVVPDLRPYIAQVMPNIDLLRVGHGDGPGCYCGPNNQLRQGLQPLLSGYDWVIVDSVAGTEFISRAVVQPTAILILQRAPHLDQLGATRRVAAAVHATLDGLQSAAPRFDVVVGGDERDELCIAVPAPPITDRLDDTCCALLSAPVLTALTRHLV